MRDVEHLNDQIDAFEVIEDVVIKKETRGREQKPEEEKYRTPRPKPLNPKPKGRPKKPDSVPNNPEASKEHRNEYYNKKLKGERICKHCGEQLGSIISLNYLSS